MHVAYLINRYPTPSHSFIRREIAALESHGCIVHRYSIRSAPIELPDRKDRDERAVTQTILEKGFAPLVWDLLYNAIFHTQGFLRAFSLAMRSALAEPRGGWRHLAYLCEACWLRRRLNGVDHVHAHFGTNPTAVARLLCRLCNKGFSFTAHGPDEFDAPKALDLKGKIADARLAIAISSYGSSQLMRWSAPEHWKKIDVIRCGVDEIFTQEPPPRDRSGRVLCCVARLSAQKGLPLLIEATAILAARDAKFSLLLIGDGEMRSEIQDMIEQRGLLDIVKIIGYQSSDAVRAHLLMAKAMVLPSFAEGLPVVLMEALALETPVITTAIAGIPELVDDECGWMVPAGSVEALADAMEEALNCPVERIERMGLVGRSRVLSSYNSLKNGKELYDYFRSFV